MRAVSLAVTFVAEVEPDYYWEASCVIVYQAPLSRQQNDAFKHQTGPKRKPIVTEGSIADRFGVPDVLRLAGIALPQKLTNLVRCPLPGHRDASPSFRVFPRGWVCFGCGRKGGILDLVVALGHARERRTAAVWVENKTR